MPILDWTRTDLNYQVSTGSYSLRFDTTAFAAFELFILKREGSTEFYSGNQISKAKVYFNGLSSHQQHVLSRNIIAGLPGGHKGYTLDEFRLILNEYKHISEADLQTNLRYFLEQVIPTAADAGVNLCIHPDDPPYPILGLPRVVSTQTDIERLLSEVDSPNNGITLCTGSFGVRGDNDMVRIARRFAHRIHFLHFRSVEVEDDGSFYEAGHLEGDSNIAGVMNALLTSDKLSGDHYIPLRPDHGQKMLDDVSKSTNPGYSCIGRMKGLAELRGLESGLRFASKHIEK
jgi:mannonate dehydratase